MKNKGSALMQVLVVGLVIAAFAVLMLRYAVTRSANLARTERILETQVIADSCLDQYMSALAYAELSGNPPLLNDLEAPQNFNCAYYSSMTTLSSIVMYSTWGSNSANAQTLITSFTVTHEQ